MYICIYQQYTTLQQKSTHGFSIIARTAD